MSLSLFLPLALSFGVPEAHAITEAMTNEQICEAAGIVVIGTVSDVNSTASGNMITSQVTFSVERMVHGPANVSNIGVHVYSGEVNGVRYSLGSTPHFVDGDRYLLLLHPRGPGVAPTIVAAGAGAIRLDASATLPSLSSLVQEWEEICDA